MYNFSAKIALEYYKILPHLRLHPHPQEILSQHATREAERASHETALAGRDETIRMHEESVTEHRAALENATQEHKAGKLQSRNPNVNPRP